MGKKLYARGCPKCGSDAGVKDSRPTKSGDIHRRRECSNPACGYRFTTIEILYGPHERCKEVAQWASEHNRDIFDKDSA